MAKQHADRFTDDDIRKYWGSDHEDVARAAKRGYFCVLVHCPLGETQALAATRVFLEAYDAPASTHFSPEDNILSLNPADAGKFARGLRVAIIQNILEHFSGSGLQINLKS